MSCDAAVALLRDLRRNHVHIEARDDRLRIRAPKGVVSESDRKALRDLKTDLLHSLGREQLLLNLTLDEFSRQDCSIELAVPWLDETLWFVPHQAQAEELSASGMAPGRVFTADPPPFNRSSSRVRISDFWTDRKGDEDGAKEVHGRADHHEAS